MLSDASWDRSSHLRRDRRGLNLGGLHLPTLLPALLLHGLPTSVKVLASFLWFPKDKKS